MLETRNRKDKKQEVEKEKLKLKEKGMREVRDSHDRSLIGTLSN